MYGFIFKSSEDDEIWLGKYENGSVKGFTNLSDYDGIYEDLKHTSVCVVEVKEEPNERILIRDITRLEVGKRKEEIIDEEDDLNLVNFEDVLEDLGFPSADSDEMFAVFLSNLGKAN